MTTLNTTKHNNKTINIVADYDSESPREWDNLGKMICFHRNYTLGDKHEIKHEDYDGWDEMESHLAKEYDAVILPVYLYDHSGITINTTGFNCPWDSGQVGFICVSKKQAREMYGWKNITKARKELLATYLIGEVETFDQYLRGDICGFEILDSDGEVEDSCYGFYSEEDAMAEAKAAA